MIIIITRRPPKGAIAQLGERVLCKHEVVGSIPSGSTMGLAVLLLSGKVKEICGCGSREPLRVHETRALFLVSGVRVFEIVKREWIRCGRYLNLPSSRRPRRPLKPDPFGKQNRSLGESLRTGLSDCLHTFCRGGAG